MVITTWQAKVNSTQPLASQKIVNTVAHKTGKVETAEVAAKGAPESSALHKIRCDMQAVLLAVTAPGWQRHPGTVAHQWGLRVRSHL